MSNERPAVQLQRDHPMINQSALLQPFVTTTLSTTDGVPNGRTQPIRQQSPRPIQETPNGGLSHDRRMQREVVEGGIGGEQGGCRSGITGGQRVGQRRSDPSHGGGGSLTHLALTEVGDEL